MMFNVILPTLQNAIITFLNESLTGDPATTYVAGRTISVEEDEVPPPEAQGFPLYFVTLHPGDWKVGEDQDTNPGLSEEFGVNVTVVHKIGFRSKTKFYDAAYSETNCMMNRIRKIITLINWRHDVLGALNTALGNVVASDRRFLTPLRLMSVEFPFRIEDGSWLGLTGEEAISRNLLLVSTIKFGGLTLKQCDTDNNKF